MFQGEQRLPQLLLFLLVHLGPGRTLYEQFTRHGLPQECGNSRIEHRRLREPPPHHSPRVFPLAQQFSTDQRAVPVWVELVIILAARFEGTPAAIAPLGLNRFRLIQPAQQIPDYIVGKEPVEVLRLKMLAG